MSMTCGHRGVQFLRASNKLLERFLFKFIQLVAFLIDVNCQSAVIGVFYFASVTLYSSYHSVEYFSDSLYLFLFS